jgi:hypothetical protein
LYLLSPPCRLVTILIIILNKNGNSCPSLLTAVLEEVK